MSEPAAASVAVAASVPALAASPSTTASSATPAADAASAAFGWGLDQLLGAVGSTGRSQWIVLAAAALFVFWSVGAHNRLVVLRNAVADAWSQVSEALRRRHEAADALLAAAREALASEQGALDAMAQAVAQNRAAAEALGARPLHPGRAAAWLAAEAGFGAAAARLTALVEAAASASPEPLPLAEPLAAFREAGRRLPFARQLYNDAAAAHDAALAQFPTSLLTRLFDFAPAGRL